MSVHIVERESVAALLEKAASKEGAADMRGMLRRAASLLRERPVPPYLVKAGRRVCEPCRMDSHECCEPIPVNENGLVDGTAYTDCVCFCNPEWMTKTYDSEAPQAPEKSLP